MGNAWYCKKCNQSSTGSRIGVSSECTERFINEETGEEFTPDERWITKLKCIDETHSKQHGLTLENFDVLIKRIENHMNKARTIPCENRNAVVNCLKRNPDCMIQCFHEMQDFINCVDVQRINIMKEKLVKSRKEEKERYDEEIFSN